MILVLSPASIKSHWVFIELGGAKALGKHVVPVLLHVGANEVPAPVSSLRPGDINDFDRYLAELRDGERGAGGRAERGRKRENASAMRTHAGKGTQLHDLPRPAELKVGDKVRIARVEHLTESDKEREPRWVSGMDKYSGLETAIVRVLESSEMVFLEVDGGVLLGRPAG